ncbi:MAG: primosomal protein N' [Arcobacter sp.]|uniref:primosomal protein N' n=1 Tax=Arcobacter sp. TaxID=1872629 RepID=UPI003B00B633
MSFFYELALLKSPLDNLTYCSDEKIEIGTLVEVSLQRRKVLSKAVIIKEVEKPTFKCTTIQTITNQFYSKEMLKIASFTSMYYVSSLGEALSLFIPFDKTIDNKDENENFESNIELSKEQEEAYEFCLKNKQSLLFANTGAGKTEIYIKAIEEHLNSGNQAILLMPEISLTPQMQKRLEKVFKEKVAIWHSKITKKRKDEIIKKVLSNEIKLVAGARSALFLPLEKLSLIIVDEEHDESYKSDSKPRYNTKDLALYISKTLDIQAILGSATPSLNTYHKVPFYRLSKTYFDTKKIINYDDSTSSLSSKIVNKIKSTIEQNHQVIIFLPTRANYKYQVCTTCGSSVECPFCSVSMSLHKNALALKCHYCGYTQQIPKSCPSCNTGVIHNLRVGTAQIEEELNFIFEDKTIKRFDRDEVKTDKELRKVLEDFNSNKIDILVGTQMLSKGHDYHNVKLAVVLGIDSILKMNSYKARERALSLLIQISGRSGRKGAGEVIIQTQNKEFFDFYLNNRDYKEFLDEELTFREDLYPPYYKLAKILFAHTNGLKVKDEFDKYTNILKTNENIEVVGANQSPIFKLANKYRYEIMVRSKNVKPLLEVLHSIESPMVSIDMDTIY